MTGMKAAMYAMQQKANLRVQSNQTLKEIQNLSKKLKKELNKIKINNAVISKFINQLKSEISQKTKDSEKIEKEIEKDSKSSVPLSKVQSSFNTLKNLHTALQNLHNQTLPKLKTLSSKFNAITQSMENIEKQLIENRDSLIKWIPIQELKSLREEFLKAKEKMNSYQLSLESPESLENAIQILEKQKNEIQKISEKIEKRILKSKEYDQKQTQLYDKVNHLRNQFLALKTQPGFLSNFPALYHEIETSIAILLKKIEQKNFNIQEDIQNVSNVINKVRKILPKSLKNQELYEEINQTLNELDLTQQTMPLIQKWFPSEYQKITNELKDIEKIKESIAKSIDVNYIQSKIEHLTKELENLNNKVSGLFKLSKENEEKLLERIDVVKALYESAQKLNLTLLTTPEYENPEDKTSPIHLQFATLDGNKIQFQVNNDNQLIGNANLPKTTCESLYENISHYLAEYGIQAKFTIAESKPPLDVLKTAKGTSHTKQKTTIKRSRRK